jgi:hypothetical protein
VAILTADSDGEKKAAALDIAFLQKPLKLPQLLSAIPKVIRPEQSVREGTR